MHRSGTSLLGSILQALGVALPGPLIPGDHHNPAGYFERSDITALQEELLIDLQALVAQCAGHPALAAGLARHTTCPTGCRLPEASAESRPTTTSPALGDQGPPHLTAVAPVAPGGR